MQFFERRLRQNYWNDWERIYTLSISHDRSCRISHHRRSQEMCRGRPRTNKYHIQKIKMSKEEGKFWRVYVLWWLTRRVKVSSNAHPTLMDCEFRSNAWDDVTQIEVLFLVSFFCGRELRAVISGKQIYYKGTNKENVWEHGNIGQFCKGIRTPSGRPSPSTENTKVVVVRVNISC